MAPIKPKKLKSGKKVAKNLHDIWLKGGRGIRPPLTKAHELLFLGLGFVFFFVFPHGGLTYFAFKSEIVPSFKSRFFSSFYSILFHSLSFSHFATKNNVVDKQSGLDSESFCFQV